jgi:hypothetical protein
MFQACPEQANHMRNRCLAPQAPECEATGRSFLRVAMWRMHAWPRLRGAWQQQVCGVGVADFRNAGGGLVGSQALGRCGCCLRGERVLHLAGHAGWTYLIHAPVKVRHEW